MRVNRATSWCVAMVFAWSCAGQPDVAVPAEVTRAEHERLAQKVEPLASCEDAADSLRSALEADVQARLDEALRSFLTADPAGCERVTRDTESEPQVPVSSLVAGSDRADSIKTDHDFIYKLDQDTSRGGALRILAREPVAQTRQVALVPLPGQPSTLFVVGERALVYSRLSEPASDCVRCVPAGGSTALLLYDVSDRAAPALLRRVDVRGELTEARQIDGRVYSVISAAPLELGLSYAPPQLDACASPEPRPDAASVVQAFEQLRAQNLAKIRALDFAPAAPIAPHEGELSACQLYRAQDRGTALTSLLSFDLRMDAPPVQTSLQSQRGAPYLSDQTLYLAVDQVHNLHAHDSAVHAVDLRTAEYRGSGWVEGRVIDASSMDERQQYLRIATRTDFIYGHSSARNLLSVLLLRDGRLQRVGQLAGILPGRDVRSVRFDGEHAFMTSFDPADPLYAFELGDPEHPVLQAELATAGYSTFQRMLDERHLLSLGYVALAGCELACFDRMVLQVSDLGESGSVVQRYELPFPGAASIGGAPLHATTIHFAGNRLAVPVSLCSVRDAGPRVAFDLSFSGVIVYDVDPETGVRELGRMANQPASAAGAERLCEDWWSRTWPEVKRCVLVDEYLYAFTPDRLHVQDVNGLGADLASVAMPTP